MTAINVFTENLYSDWKLDDKDVIEKTTRLLRYYIRSLEENSCLKGYEYSSLTLDIVFCDSQTTHELNLEYRKIDKPADIITFAIFADNEDRFVCDGDINLGEIVIALDKVTEMVNSDISMAKNRDQELYFLISHGLMHLLGFDHRDDKEYNFVISEQRKALEVINYDKI